MEDQYEDDQHRAEHQGNLTHALGAQPALEMLDREDPGDGPDEGRFAADQHLLTSAAFLSMVLPLVIFFALQRYFIQGILAGSVIG